MVVPALLFTILLQMALVGLLWQAAVTGGLPLLQICSYCLQPVLSLLRQLAMLDSV
jgi:hypothetical protein